MANPYLDLDEAIEELDRESNVDIANWLRELRAALQLLDRIESEGGDAPHRAATLSERIRVQLSPTRVANPSA